MGSLNIVAVVALKGGTGKSTLASNLAVAGVRAGLKTLAIDADPQGSLAQWKRFRGGDDLMVSPGKTSTLHPMRFAAERSGTELAVIDTRASSLDNMLEAAKAAHLTLIVARPTPIDVRAVAATVEALRPLQRPSAIVLNQAPTLRGGREPALVTESIEALRAHGLPIAPVVVRNRSAYQTAFLHGRSPLELECEAAAAGEIGELWNYVEARLRQAVQQLRPAPAVRTRGRPPLPPIRAMAV